jgi:hypothetical protein
MSIVKATQSRDTLRTNGNNFPTAASKHPSFAHAKCDRTRYSPNMACSYPQESRSDLMHSRFSSALFPKWLAYR